MVRSQEVFTPTKSTALLLYPSSSEAVTRVRLETVSPKRRHLTGGSLQEVELQGTYLNDMSVFSAPTPSSSKSRTMLG